MTKRCEVLIVGGGLTGAALACALAQEDFSVILLDAQPLAPPEVPPGAPGVQDCDLRVSTLTPTSRAFLEGIDAWPLLAPQRVARFRYMYVWDQGGSGSVSFDAAEDGRRALGYVAENRVLQHALLERLEGFPRARLLSPAKPARLQLPSGDGGAKQRGALFLEDGTRLEAQLIVAADGARSTLRTLGDIPTRSWDYRQDAIVCTVCCAHSHRDTAWQIFTRSGPLAFLPLAGNEGRCCSIVWSVEREEARRLIALEDAPFAAQLGHAFEHRLGDIRECSPRRGFPLGQCHARRYVRPGLALVGDAAHSFHPLAGQGVNLGLLDCAVLCRELSWGRQRGIPPGEEAILKRYQRRRIGHNLLMMGVVEGCKQLFRPSWSPVPQIRNQGLRLFNRATPLKKAVMRRAMGIGF